MPTYLKPELRHLFTDEEMLNTIREAIRRVDAKLETPLDLTLRQAGNLALDIFCALNASGLLAPYEERDHDP